MEIRQGSNRADCVVVWAIERTLVFTPTEKGAAKDFKHRDNMI